MEVSDHAPNWEFHIYSGPTQSSTPSDKSVIPLIQVVFHSRFMRFEQESGVRREIRTVGRRAECKPVEDVGLVSDV